MYMSISSKSIICMELLIFQFLNIKKINKKNVRYIMSSAQNPSFVHNFLLLNPVYLYGGPEARICQCVYKKNCIEIASKHVHKQDLFPVWKPFKCHELFAFNIKNMTTIYQILSSWNYFAPTRQDIWGSGRICCTTGKNVSITILG